MRHELDRTLCYQVDVRKIFSCAENDLVLLKALLLEAGVQFGHV